MKKYQQMGQRFIQSSRKMDNGKPKNAVPTGIR